MALLAPKSLTRETMLRLYRCRDEVRPGKTDLSRTVNFMRDDHRNGVPFRENELGWYWVRRLTRAELKRLLVSKLDDLNPKSAARARCRRVAGYAAKRAKLLNQLQRGTMNDEERLDVIRCLAAVRYRADVPLFRQLAKKASFPVGLALGPALSLLRQPGDAEILYRLASMNVSTATDALVSWPHKAAHAAITQIARSRDSCLRANLAVRLGAWRNQACRRMLRRMAQDTDEYVRNGAASSLGEVGHPDDLPMLRRLARDSSSRVRLEAIWGVGLHRHKRDLPLLKRSAFDQAPEVRGAAALALTRVLPKKELERWVNQEVHRLSFEALRELDFALYAPAWVQKQHPRIGDCHRLLLGFARPNYWLRQPGHAAQSSC